MARPEDKCVLVVDDEPDIVTFLRTALEDAGFRVESAGSVDEALDSIKARPPDCISLDMVMPRKSGIVLFHELRRNPAWASIPVLFVTGHAREQPVRQALDAAASLAESTLSGPATYLEKPVTAHAFVEAVARVLRVELEDQGPPSDAGGDRLRRELLDLVNRADPDALREALKVLQPKPRAGDETET